VPAVPVDVPPEVAPQEAPPTPELPEFEFPTYGGPSSPYFREPNLPTFDAPDFYVPSYQDALNEPGYQFRLGSGQSALENSAAARGVLRTGGTLKDILEYGQAFGSQEYANVFDRALRAYGARYQAAKDEYAPYMAQYQGRLGLEQARALAEFQRAWDLYNTDVENARYKDAVIRDLFNSDQPPMPGG
jgi:hypothetical protein